MQLLVLHAVCLGSAETRQHLQASKTELTEHKAAAQALRAELAELKKDRDVSMRAVKSAEHSVSATDARLQHLTEEVGGLID